MSGSEAFEEAGITVEVEPEVFNVYNFRDDPRSDMVVIVHKACIEEGQLQAGDEIENAKVSSVNEVKDLLQDNQVAFECNRRSLIEWIKEKTGETDGQLWELYLDKQVSNETD